ncbi:bacteriophage tail protein GpU [Escherichia coli]|uniref:Bacteriophage tail protein GpU n=1 Tax=Escherichia coli TaxID=562 RepID=A0A377AJZ0_ECOLX|nr:bacteriophage tail protein GpU [Escherichia coli]
MALIEGSGTIYGMYVIEGLNQTKTEFFSAMVCRAGLSSPVAQTGG